MATVWSPGVSEQRKVSNGKMANVEIEWIAFRETPACGSLGRQARLRGARRRVGRAPGPRGAHGLGPAPARGAPGPPAFALFQSLSL